MSANIPPSYEEATASIPSFPLIQSGPADGGNSDWPAKAPSCGEAFHGTEAYGTRIPAIPCLPYICILAILVAVTGLVWFGLM